MKKDEIRNMYKTCSEILTEETNDIHHLMLGEGNFEAEIMIITDIVTATEENIDQNLTLPHRAKLEELLRSLGKSMDDIYITHIVKYRPYRLNNHGRRVNRSPEDNEFEFFMPYLEKEIKMINPKLIITLGNSTLQWITKDPKMKVDLRRDQFMLVGIQGTNFKVYPMYFPSSKYFEKSLEKAIHEDLERLEQAIMDNNEPRGLTKLEQSFKDLPANKNIEKSQKEQTSLGQSDTASSDVEMNKVDKSSSSEAKPKQINPNPIEEGQKPNKPDKQETNPQEEVATEAKKSETKKRIYEKIELEPLAEKNGNRRYVTMIYGGEGFIDDPVLVAFERLGDVFTELGVGIHRVDLHRSDYTMESLLRYIRESNGVIIGIQVEWFGIGYRLQQFLDDCFYRGDQSYFQDTKLMGVCFTKHTYEQEAYQYLLKSWQLLGGVEGLSLTGCIENAAILETTFDWLYGIDKKAEFFYRMIQQDSKGQLPASSSMKKIIVEMPVFAKGARSEVKEEELNPIKPQDTAVSGTIENYDEFVEKQQKDIQNISQLFKRKLFGTTLKNQEQFPEMLKKAYVNEDEIEAKIQLLFLDQAKNNTVIELKNDNIRTYYGQIADYSVSVSGKKEALIKILRGRQTMQRAFMTGEIKAKGDFTLLYKFDQYFKL